MMWFHSLVLPAHANWRVAIMFPQQLNSAEHWSQTLNMLSKKISY